MTAFTHLLQPLRIRGCTLKNRIMSTGHDTTLPVDGTVNRGAGGLSGGAGPRRRRF